MRHTPHTETRTRTSPGPGSGSGRSTNASGLSSMGTGVERPRTRIGPFYSRRQEVAGRACRAVAFRSAMRWPASRSRWRRSGGRNTSTSGPRASSSATADSTEASQRRHLDPTWAIGRGLRTANAEVGRAAEESSPGAGREATARAWRAWVAGRRRQPARKAGGACWSRPGGGRSLRPVPSRRTPVPRRRSARRCRAAPSARRPRADPPAAWRSCALAGGGGAGAGSAVRPAPSRLRGIHDRRCQTSFAMILPLSDRSVPWQLSAEGSET